MTQHQKEGAGSVPYERITVDPEVMGGLPCIRGLRIPVASVVAMVADGMSAGEIVDLLLFSWAVRECRAQAAAGEHGHGH